MKTLYFTLLLIVFCKTLGFSQDDNVSAEPKNLFGTGSKLTGWFVDFNDTYTQLNGQITYMPGFSAGVVMNRNFRVGVLGKSLSWYPEYMRYDNVLSEPVFLEGGYAALLIESCPIDKNILHITIPIIAGGGECKYRSVEEYPEIEDEGEIDYGHNTLSRSPFFVIEPGVNVELNVTGFLRIYAGYSYRWMPGFNLANTSRNAFNNSNLNFGLKIGKF